MTILISNKANSQQIIRDKEKHYIKVSWSILQEGIMIFNVYVTNNRTSK